MNHRREAERLGAGHGAKLGDHGGERPVVGRMRPRVEGRGPGRSPHALVKRGVRLYEATPVLALERGVARTAGGSVRAKHFIVATDRFLPELGLEQRDIYHAQTFLTVSTPLSQDQIERIFPGDRTMVWDTDLIYQYFRLVEGNRLLLGASSLRYTFRHHEEDVLSPVLRKIRQPRRR